MTLLQRLLGRWLEPARVEEPRQPVDSNVDTAAWFDAPHPATDAERYRAAPPLGRDTIDSDPQVARWYRRH